jgi:hypothetical protein
MSAGVLLVPPLLIGGAVYGLLPAREDGGARDSALAAFESLPADFNSRAAFDTGLQPPSAVTAWASPDTNAFGTAKPALPAAPEPVAAAIAVAVAPKPAVPTAAIKPAAAKRDAPPAKSAVAAAKVTTPEPTTFALASEHSELVGREATRTGALGPVPVQVTVVVAPNAAETEDRQPVSLGAAPPPAIAALPPAPMDAPPAATAARSTEPPREHHAGTQHGTGFHFRHLARHNRARPEASSEERTTQQRPAEPPQHDFSLRNLFQQQGGQGVRQKNAVRG